jgi:hypothetical protein
MDSYVLKRWNVDATTSSPQYQGDCGCDKMIVETPYGFGIVLESENQFDLVKVSLLSGGSVSLPWDRIRVLPERPVEVLEQIDRPSKRASSPITNSRKRYIFN